MLLILQIALGIWLGTMLVILTLAAYMECQKQWQSHKNRQWTRRWSAAR